MKKTIIAAVSLLLISASGFAGNNDSNRIERLERDVAALKAQLLPNLSGMSLCRGRIETMSGYEYFAGASFNGEEDAITALKNSCYTWVIEHDAYPNSSIYRSRRGFMDRCTIIRESCSTYKNFSF